MEFISSFIASLSNPWLVAVLIAGLALVVLGADWLVDGASSIARRAAKVIGIEYVPEAIADARVNAEANGITNCEWFAGDMKDILTDAFIAAHGRPDVIILDPPRAGIHPDVARVILRAEARRIVYVSCNPASQARDLAILSDKYRITGVQPVDMFPHTMHVENVCALELK